VGTSVSAEPWASGAGPGHSGTGVVPACAALVKPETISATGNNKLATYLITLNLRLLSRPLDRLAIATAILRATAS
jgi:hypothetical protein